MIEEVYYGNCRAEQSILDIPHTELVRARSPMAFVENLSCRQREAHLDSNNSTNQKITILAGCNP